MRKRLPGLRLGVVLLLMIGMLSPFAATGAGAQDLTCDDFNSQRAAQAVLEADPSLEDALDADGDGVACNEDEPTDDPTDEPTDDPTEEPIDEPTDDPTEEPTDEPSGDADAYLEDVQAEVDDLQAQVERFLEIDALGADATRDDVDELNEIAAGWIEYPDVAAELVAPAEYADIEDGYLDLADSFAEAGELWEVYWSIPSGDPEEDAALQEFNDVFIDAQDQIVDLNDLIAEAGGSTTPTDDPTEEPTDDPTDEPAADDDAYVEDVQAEIDDLQEQVDRFQEIQTDAGSGDLTEAELSDAADEINDLAAGWVEYPDVAAELVAPEGLEDLEDAYLGLADTVGEAGELWEAYWAIPSGDPEEDAALDDFQAAFTDVQDGIDEVQDLVDEAGGSTGPSDDPTEEPTDEPTEEPTDDPTDEPSGDADAYLATVSENAADWQASLDRFSEIIGQGADATDAEFAELTDILVAWAEAPDVAAELDAPAGFEDIQQAYEDFADELSVASTAIADYLAADPESPEADAAFDDFITAVGNAEDLSAELDDLLADAGA